MFGNISFYKTNVHYKVLMVFDVSNSNILWTRMCVYLQLYHACDGGRRAEFTWCVLPHQLLAVCDFLASATSIWITLVAMSRPPLQATA